MKVVINKCFGGFELSEEGMESYLNSKNIFYEKRKGFGLLSFYDEKGEYISPYIYDHGRNDPDLINVVETLGERSFGPCSKLEIVNIPDDVKYEIEEHDGWEKLKIVYKDF